MFRVARLSIAAAACTAYAVSASAQGALPTSQPNYLTIVREEVKLGRAADHERIEAGWPAAYEKAKSPDYYLAYVSTTGRPEAWFVSPFDSHKAMADSMKRESEDALAAEIRRLQRADADVVNSVTVIQAMGRKDLSVGAFPDTAKVRFTEITIFRVRPGHERGFEEAAKAYGAAAKRSSPNVSFRIYQVIAGIPGPTYLVFSSNDSFADFDRAMQEDMAIMKGATPEELKTLEQVSAEGLVNVETQRFRVDPVMSYVPKEVRASDPAFWMPKRPTAKPTTTTQQQ